MSKVFLYFIIPFISIIQTFSEPLSVNADNMVISKNLSLFSGNVAILYKGIRLNCDMAELYFTRDKKKITLLSLKIPTILSVRSKKQNITANSGSINFQNQTFLLSDNIKISSNNFKLFGEKAFYDKATAKFIISGGKTKKRVKCNIPKRDKK